MTTSKILTEVLPNRRQGDGEWLPITPGERFKIRTSAEETEEAYTMLELVADPQNGAPMRSWQHQRHRHRNRGEGDGHFTRKRTAKAP